VLAVCEIRVSATQTLRTEAIVEMTRQIACVDVGYRGGRAVAACVLFGSWEDVRPAGEVTAEIAHVEPYVPGAFYKRELPCLLAVLEQVRVPLRAVLIDGYVWLSAGRPGLGAHLYESLGRRAPVVGVAKTAFRGNTEAVSVLRGQSARPLYVTAAGMPASEAAVRVRAMHGRGRIPTLLACVDRLSRRA
jgi:deoxyribonuclease V